MIRPSLASFPSWARPFRLVAVCGASALIQGRRFHCAAIPEHLSSVQLHCLSASCFAFPDRIIAIYRLLSPFLVMALRFLAFPVRLCSFLFQIVSYLIFSSSIRVAAVPVRCYSFLFRSGSSRFWSFPGLFWSAPFFSKYFRVISLLIANQSISGADLLT